MYSHATRLRHLLPHRRFLCAFALLTVGFPRFTTAQVPAPLDVRVSGPGLAQPVSLSAADLAKLPRIQVTRPDHDGKKHTYSGPSLNAVLAAAGTTPGSALPRKGMAHYLLVNAADGYQAVFALAELNPAFAPRTVLLATRCDGQPLSAKDGPYQIIVPDEKKMGRCVRQVQSLQVLAAKP